jgi:hypothetical protein
MESLERAAVVRWVPLVGGLFADGSDGQEDELEDVRRGKLDRSTGPEVAESNKVDPDSKDEDDLEAALRRAGIKPM